MHYKSGIPFLIAIIPIIWYLFEKNKVCPEKLNFFSNRYQILGIIAIKNMDYWMAYYIIIIIIIIIITSTMPVFMRLCFFLFYLL